MSHAIRLPLRPTAIGQRIRFTGFGGRVRQYHVDLYGTVVGFTSSGNPIVLLDSSPTHNPNRRIIDRHGCAQVVDELGTLLWQS